MKVRLEAQKTTLRLNKEEFEALKNQAILSETTLFPGGQSIEFNARLGEEKVLQFSDNKMTFILPNQSIQCYTPSKVGLSFIFQVGSAENHEVIFEVDIKKPPLGSKSSLKK